MKKMIALLMAMLMLLSTVSLAVAEIVETEAVETEAVETEVAATEEAAAVAEQKDSTWLKLPTPFPAITSTLLSKPAAPASGRLKSTSA